MVKVRLVETPGDPDDQTSMTERIVELAGYPRQFDLIDWIVEDDDGEPIYMIGVVTSVAWHIGAEMPDVRVKINALKEVKRD